MLHIQNKDLWKVWEVKNTTYIEDCDHSQKNLSY